MADLDDILTFVKVAQFESISGQPPHWVCRSRRHTHSEWLKFLRKIDRRDSTFPHQAAPLSVAVHLHNGRRWGRLLRILHSVRRHRPVSARRKSPQVCRMKKVRSAPEPKSLRHLHQVEVVSAPGYCHTIIYAAGRGETPVLPGNQWGKH